MKVRNGFVSNSSSTSFILKWSKLSKVDKKEIQRLTERSNDLTRCTGYIAKSNLENWLSELRGQYIGEWKGYGLFQLIEKNRVDGKNDLVLIRYSDEEMGGKFNSELWKLTKKAILEFEYH